MINGMLRVDVFIEVVTHARMSGGAAAVASRAHHE